MESENLPIAVWFTYAVIASAIIYFVWRQLRNKSGSSPRSKSSNAPVLRTERAASGLQSDILKEGTGEGAKAGDRLTVEYVVSLADGKKVDSSYNRGRPMIFRLGFREVIEGWDKALKGAKVGEKRIITVPPALAYGNGGGSKIPPGATLIFEVEVTDIAAKK